MLLQYPMWREAILHDLEFEVTENEGVIDNSVLDFMVVAWDTQNPESPQIPILTSNEYSDGLENGIHSIKLPTRRGNDGQVFP